MAKTSSAREDMLEAAIDLFRHRGYEGVGVAELLTKANAPRGSLYFHFPGGKEQIGAEVVRRVGETVAAQFRALHESGVDLDTFVHRVFRTTAKDCESRQFKASCPMAAIAAEFSNESPQLSDAVRDAFKAWEDEIRIAARARGLSDTNADIFASAMLTSMEGAFILSKAQSSALPHENAARAMKALANALVSN